DMAEIESSLFDRARRIIGDLRQFSNVKFGQYWNTATKSPQGATLLTKITRSIWYSNEGREITLTYIDTLIDSGFGVMEDIYVEMQKDYARSSLLKYADLLKEVKTGILN